MQGTQTTDSAHAASEIHACNYSAAPAAHAYTRAQARGATPELRRVTNTTPHGLPAGRHSTRTTIVSPSPLTQLPRCMYATIQRHQHTRVHARTGPWRHACAAACRRHHTTRLVRRQALRKTTIGSPKVALVRSRGFRENRVDSHLGLMLLDRAEKFLEGRGGCQIQCIYICIYIYSYIYI